MLMLSSWAVAAAALALAACGAVSQPLDLAHHVSLARGPFIQRQEHDYLLHCSAAAEARAVLVGLAAEAPSGLRASPALPR